MKLHVRPANRWHVASRLPRLSARLAQREIDDLRRSQAGFVHVATPMAAFDDTRFHVSTDGKDLLVAAALYNSQGKPGLEESLELFFDPYHDHLGFFQFIFTNGAEPQVFHHLPYPDAASSAFPWMRVKEHRFEDRATTNVIGQPDVDRWCFARFAVPEVFRAGAVCGFNVCRFRNVTGEGSSWNLSAGNGFVDAMSFGHLYLDGEPAEVRVDRAVLEGDELVLEGEVAGPRGAEGLTMELVDPMDERAPLSLELDGGRWRCVHRPRSREPGRYRLYPGLGRRPIEPEFLQFDLAPQPGRSRFELTMFYDIPDDLRAGMYTPDRLRGQLAQLRQWGIDRLHWIEYGPTDANTSFWDSVSSLKNCRATARACGDLLPAAVELAHELGMRFYSTFKPFDMGFTHPVFDRPAKDRVRGLENRWSPVLQDVADHQALTMRAHPAWQPDFSLPIARVALQSEGPLPKLKPEDVRLWVSADNRAWKPYRRAFKVRQMAVNLPHVRWTPAGDAPLSGGGKRRNWLLELSSLRIDVPYAAVEVRERGREGFRCVNREWLLVEAHDAQGRRAQAHLSDSGGVETRFGFMELWPGWADYTERRLGRRTWDGRPLGLAFLPDEAMPELLEPTYEGALRVWLNWVTRQLDAGADGVDIRILCHHSACSAWLVYAFAEGVRDAFRSRFGRDVEPTDADYEQVRRLRGEALTQLLREAKALTAARGKKLCVHLECGVEVPPSMHTRMQIHLDWERWVREGLADELMAKFWTSQSRFVHERVLPLARRHGVPVHICEMNFSLHVPHGVERGRRLVREARDAGLAGFAFYETASYARLNPAGESLPIGHADAAIAAGAVAIS